MKNTHYTAFLAAFLITACMGVGMLLIGGGAFLNRHGVPVNSSAGAAVAPGQDGTQAQIRQLQDLVQQYQGRETQYQQELQAAGKSLQEANSQLQQYQLLFMELQNRGMIAINPDGSISLAR